MLLNAYAEGLKAASRSQFSTADCPYRSALVLHERAEWLRGFNARRLDHSAIDKGSSTSGGRGGLQR